MSINIAQSASFTVNGLSPAAGAGLTLLANPALGITNVTHDDYVADTFTVNPSTVAATLPLGEIVSGKIVWIQTDQPITVIFTQNLVANSIIVDSFLFTNLTFTQLQISNTSPVNAAHVSVVAVGERVTNPGTPGIY